MAGYFPKPYPDELLFSLIARYKKHYGIVSDKEVNLDIYGKSTIAASCAYDIPYGLKKLSAYMGLQQLSPGYLLENHTLWPFYRCFVQERSKERLLQQFQEDCGNKLHITSGINSSAYIRNYFLWYCPQCYNEDIEQFGEPYWHRIHAIPSIQICSKHKVYLISPRDRALFRGRNRYLGLEEVYKHREVKACGDKNIVSVSQKLSFFLQQPGMLARNYPYKEKLKELGYSRANGSLNFPLVSNKLKPIIQYFDTSPYLKLDQLFWVRDLYNRPDRVFHPLRHAILQVFIDENMPAATCKLTNPFGKGPWICLNSAASHFQHQVVKSLSVRQDRKSKRILGTFRCSCGMEYTRSYTANLDQKTHFLRIQAYGFVWISRLNELIQAKLPLREIARELNADPNTILYQASKAQIKNQWASRKSNRTKKKDLAIPESKRRAWLTILNIEGSVKSARLKDQALYAWLYRNDHSWLLKINKTYHLNKFNREQRRNWQERDEEIAKLIVKAFEEVLLKNINQRISKSLLINMLPAGYAYVQKYLDKLPKSRSLLESKSESIPEYQARRVKKILEQQKSSALPIKLWELLRRAGLKQPINAELLSLISKNIR
jgi:hypothetical protein